MAERRGTGGRGSVSQLPEVPNLDDFMVVPEAQEISRSTAAPSPYQPLVDLARQNLNQRIERTALVEVPGEDGEEPRQERQPVTYSREEAEAFVAELDAIRTRANLPAKGQSLRIVASNAAGQKLSKTDADGPFRVQFYVTRYGTGKDQGNGQ
jgi:hypothetical protein